MHIAIAFAAPEAKRRNSSGFQRMGKEEFLKLPLNQQKRYVEQYPQTSHRLLIKGLNIEERAEGKLVPAKKQKDQQVAVNAKEAAKQVAPTAGDDDIFARRRKFEEQKRNSAIRKDISDLNKTNVGAITPHSLQAIDTIKTHEVRAAAENITKNKESIVSAVKEQAEKRPNMFGRGLDTIKRVLGRDTDPKELSVTERYAAERSLTSIATMAMFGAGIVAFGVAGAPLGVIAGRVLFDMWMKKGKGQHLANDLSKLRDARRRKAKMKEKERQAEIAERDGLAFNYDTKEGGSTYGKENDAAAETAKRLAEKDEVQKARDKKRTAPKSKGSKDSRQLAAASAYNPVDHDDTINLVVEQIADILKYQSVEDLKEHRDDMFKTTAAASQSELEYILTLALCHGFEQTGEGMTFVCPDLSALRSICQNTLGMHLESYSQGVFNYTKDNALVSFGRSDKPETYYIRTVGPLR